MALQTDEIRLRVLHSRVPPPLPKQPPPVLPKPAAKKHRPSDLVISKPSESPSPTKALASPHKSTPVTPTSTTSTESNPVDSPTKKVPPTVPARHPSTALSSPTKTKITAPTNTRKIGKKIPIQLTKGKHLLHLFETPVMNI